MALRVLIVAENISMRMGGEASLPFYYAKEFSALGVEVWLACHERVADEVASSFPELEGRVRVVRDTRAQKLVHALSQRVPYRVRDLVVAQAIHASTQIRLRAVARALAREGKIDIVLEPAPITPKGLSLLYDLGVPVAIGPLGGGMDFPPAFRDLDSALTRGTIALARRGSDLAHRLVPGKLRADVLMVANEWTLRALPSGCRGRIVRIFESGVDLDLWRPPPPRPSASSEAPRDVRFLFSGRFVDWKGIQFLLPAFEAAVAEEPQCFLDLVGGGGELEGEVDRMIDRPRLRGRVRRHGWLSREAAAKILADADAFVMPSLRECGGTAILEALAMGKPVIATKWGGPSDYVTPGCGVLVEPSSKPEFVEGLTRAMVSLARSPETRRAMGAAGTLRVRRDFLDWRSKAARVLSVLEEAVHGRRRESLAKEPRFASVDGPP